jgi:hypothetical protein
MKIIENSARRLDLRVEGMLHAAQCALDRNTGEAEIVRFVLGLPWIKRRVSLGQVSNVTVKRPNNRKSYFATLQLANGEELKLAGTSKDVAMDAARAIRDFLRAKPTVG